MHLPRERQRMPAQLRWWRGLGRRVVALAATAVAVAGVPAWAGDEPHPNLLAPQQASLAAVVPPPDAPVPPLLEGSEGGEGVSVPEASSDSLPILSAVPGSPALLPPGRLVARWNLSGRG